MDKDEGSGRTAIRAEKSATAPTGFPQDFRKLWETHAVLLVELAYPPADLFKNVRVHRFRRARATKAYRTEAGWAAAARLRELGLAPPRWEKARIFVGAAVGAHPARVPDPSNLAFALEPAWDGLEDAGLIANDRGLEVGPPRIFGRLPWGRVLVLAWEISAGPTTTGLNPPIGEDR